MFIYKVQYKKEEHDQVHLGHLRYQPNIYDRSWKNSRGKVHETPPLHHIILRGRVSTSFFFFKLDDKPKTWEERLAFYVTYLTEEVKRKPGTMQSYVSGTKAILESEGIHLNNDISQLNALVRACRAGDDQLFVRLPIQRNLMIMILDRMED